MSEVPYMPLYTSDFVGDTMHLSAEEIGAYMLLLMAMWNAGGWLPAHPSKLAKVARVTPKKWAAIWESLEPYFEVEDGEIFNYRLTKERQKVDSKSEKRSAAGAKGGHAKALKSKKAALANASDLPQQNPAILHNHIPEEEKTEPDGSAKKNPTGYRLPDDWQPSEANVVYAAEQGLEPPQIRFEAENFRDYWHAKAGKDATKRDWDATWRTWVRRAKQWQGQPRGSPRSPDMIDELEHFIGGRQ